MTGLATLGGGDSTAYDIKAAGQVVGRATTASGNGRAVLWQPNGAMIDLGTLGGPSSAATGINAAGQVVGQATTTSGTLHGFLWQSGGPMADLGTLGGSYSIAFSVNATGQVVGWSAIAGEYAHAFLWQNGAMADLGTLGGNSSLAVDINAAGQVVGWATTAGGDGHAFLWQQNGGMIDLNSLLPSGSGWVLEGASGINDAGQIVGTGSYNGQARAFLLTPTPAAQQLANLVTLVQSFNLQQGISNSLDAKLQRVQDALAAAKAGNGAATCNQLDAFIGEVQAQAGKALTPAQANQLIAAATTIKAALGCP